MSDSVIPGTPDLSEDEEVKPQESTVQEDIEITGEEEEEESTENPIEQASVTELEFSEIILDTLDENDENPGEEEEEFTPPEQIETEPDNVEPLAPESQIFLTKSEEDALDETRKKAKEKIDETNKEEIRKELKTLKMEFRALAQKNDEISETYRVPRENFELDPRIKAPKREKVLKEVGEIYRKYEWEGQRSVLACEKIQKFFLDNIETPHVVVKDLEHTTQVHTIRHRCLTPLFWEVFEKNKELLITEESLLNAPTESQSENVKTQIEPVKQYFAKDLIGDYEGKKYNIKTIHAIRQLEDRLLKKYNRECELAEIMEEKVPDDYEAPEDVEVIKHAEATMGDYKMKTAEDYKGEQISLAERRQRILALKLWIYNRIVEFNHLIRKLQHEKIHVLQKCKKLETKIRDVQKQIQLDMRKPLPVIHDIEEMEMSEKIFEIAPELITERQNKKLEAAGLSKRKAELDQMLITGSEIEFPTVETPTSHTPTSGPRKRNPVFKEGEFIRGRDDPRAPKIHVKNAQDQASLQSQQKGPQAYGGGGGKVMGKALNLEGLSVAVWKYRKSMFNPKTDAGIRKRDRILAIRCFERDILMNKLQRLINYFKERVTRVRNERLELDLDIKLMTIGLYILIRELNIVQECDAREKDINDGQKAQRIECAFISERLKRVSKRVIRAEADKAKIEEALGKIHKEATHIIGEKGRFVKYLWKLYRKRAKDEDEDGEESKENTIEENEEDEEEGEDSEEEDNEDKSTNSISSESAHSNPNPPPSLVDETESEELSLKSPKQKHNIFICPEDLDPTLYEKVSELRQSRIFLELGLAEQSQVVEKVRNDFQQLENNKARLEYRIEEMTLELSTLESNKILKMNGLKNLVILKADQIQCLDDETDDQSMKGGLLDRLRKNFPNMDTAIVFPKDGTQRLDMRIEEMKGEILTEKEKQKRARHMIIRLREELHTKEQRVEILEQACKKDMIGKFGRVVDLDNICAASINLEILDALQSLENKRNCYYNERDALQQQIDDTKFDLTGVTKINSECNTLLAILEERQRDVDYFLYKQNKDKDMMTPSEKSKLTTVKYEPSGSKYFGDNDDVVDEMYELEDRLINQEAKIAYLRETISVAKAKHGIPPIVPFTCIPDEVGSKFMTFQELQEYKRLISGEVETLYKKENITERLLKSESKVPSLDDTKVKEDEDEDTTENLGIPTEEAMEDNKYFRFKQGDEMGGEGYPDGYPINIIPDDQMQEPETDIEEVEEEYETDPIPVSRPGESQKPKVTVEVKPKQPESQVDKNVEEELEEIEDETETIKQEKGIEEEEEIPEEVAFEVEAEEEAEAIIEEIEENEE